MMDKYVEMVKKIVLSKIDVSTTAVFLFGGRAKGSTHRGSDVDIGLLAKQAITVDSIIDIRNAIESSIVPYHVDVVDFLTADSNFKRVALEKIVIWNKPADISIG